MSPRNGKNSQSEVRLKREDQIKSIAKDYLYAVGKFEEQTADEDVSYTEGQQMRMSHMLKEEWMKSWGNALKGDWLSNPYQIKQTNQQPEVRILRILKDGVLKGPMMISKPLICSSSIFSISQRVMKGDFDTEGHLSVFLIINFCAVFYLCLIKSDGSSDTLWNLEQKQQCTYLYHKTTNASFKERWCILSYT